MAHQWLFVKLTFSAPLVSCISLRIAVDSDKHKDTIFHNVMFPLFGQEYCMKGSQITETWCPCIISIFWKIDRAPEAPLFTIQGTKPTKVVGSILYVQSHVYAHPTQNKSLSKVSYSLR